MNARPCVKKEGIFSSRGVRLAAMGLGFVLAFLVAAPEAEAVQIKRVIQGTESFLGDDVSNSVSLGLGAGDYVDTSKAFIYITSSSPTATQDQYIFFYAYFEDGQNINITRGTSTTTTSNVAWYVVEFVDGVSVQRGLTSWAKNDLTKDCILTAIDQGKSFPIVNDGGLINTNRDTEVLNVLPYFTSDTVLRLERKRTALNAGISKTVIISWQVVQFATDATVSTGSGNFAANETQATPSISPALTASYATQSFPIVYGAGSLAINGVDDMIFVRGRLTAANQMTLNRQFATGIAGDECYYRFYAVELTDGATTSQSSTVTLNSTVLSNTATLNPTMDYANRVVPFISMMGGNSSTNAIQADDIFTRVELTNSSRMTFTRQAAYAGVVTTIDYSAVEFTPVTIKTPDGGTAQQGANAWVVGNSYQILWKHADSVNTDDWKLQYSLNSGGSYSDMGSWCGAAGTAACTGTDFTVDSGSAVTNEGSVLWKIPESPDFIGTQARVRIVDTTRTEAEARRRDSSNFDFTIRGSVTNVALSDTQGALSGSNPLGVGNADLNVTWNHTGSIGNVIIELDPNGDGNYADAITIKDSTSGTAAGCDAACNAWTVPDNVTTNAKIRVKEISPPSGTTVEAVSPAFEIRPFVVFFRPIAGDTWVRGQGQSPTASNGVVRWCQKGTVSGVDIRYSSNGGNAYSGEADKVAAGLTSGGTCDASHFCPDSGQTGCTGGTQYKYNWTLPGDLTLSDGNAKLKMVKTGDLQELVSDTTGLFTVKASVQLDLPIVDSSAPLRYQTGSALTTISWTSPGGGQGVVKLMYCDGYVANGCQNNPGDSDWILMTDPSTATNLTTPGTYDWKVQAAIGIDVGIMVADMTNPTLIYAMNGPYTVKASITVNEPGGAQTMLQVGESRTITWTPSGTIGTVYICLDKTDNGTCDYEIAGAAENIQATAGQWSDWQPPAGGATEVPNEQCANCRIRVYKPGDGADPAGTVGKSGLFSLGRALNTVAVSGTPPRKIGDVVDVTWNAFPNDATWTVTPKWSTDGTNWNNLYSGPSTRAANGSPSSWTIPDLSAIVSSAVRVRIEDSANSNLISDSGLFQVKGTLTLTQPAGSPWKIGTPHDIVWSRTGGTGIANVNIKYSLDGGTSYPSQYTIKTLSGGGSPFSWCVGKNDGCSGTTPGVPPNDPLLVIGANDKNTIVKIMVEDADDTKGSVGGGTYSEATANITIQKDYSAVLIGGLVSGAVLYVGDTNGTDRIKWTTVGDSSSNVFLAYQTSGYTFPTNNIKDVPGASDVNAYHLWTVPDSIGAAVKVRIKNANFPADIYADSGTFLIKGKITTAFPTTGSVLVVGQDVPGGIQYAKYGDIGNLEIVYRHGTYDTVITPPASPGPEGTSEGTTFAWNVVPTDSNNGSVIHVGLGQPTSKFILTGLTQKGDPALEATVETPLFKIRGDLYNGAASQLLSEPAGGEVYAIGGVTQRYVRWRARGIIGNVRVRLDLNDGRGDDNVENTSDDYEIQIQRPNSACGTPPCYAESVPYNLEEDTSDTNNFSMEWLIPDSTTYKARIRVESLDNPYDYNDPANAMATYAITGRFDNQKFWIRPNVDVVTPDGAQNPQWKTGETGKSIIVSSSGAAKLDVWLCYNNTTSDWPNCSSKYVIATDLQVPAGNKEFSWNIPNDFSTENAMIHVQWSDQPSISAESAAIFKIKSALGITYPNQFSDEIVVGSSDASNDITWTAIGVGPSDTVKINVSTDGTTWNDGTPTYANLGGLIVGSASATSGVYTSWTVQDIMSDAAKIRVCKNEGAATGEACAISNVFNIIGSISSVYIKNAVNDPEPPNPVVDLSIQDKTKVITWKYTGSLDTVNIEYSIDASAGTPSWFPVIGCQGVSVGTGGSGSCVWDPSAGIPGPPSSDVKVRVSNTQHHNPTPDSWKDLTTVGTQTHSIIGSITEVGVVSDADGSILRVHGSKSIRWKQNGGITSFDIKYRVGGGSWLGTGLDNVAGAENGGYLTQEWTGIPDNISNDVDFLVADHNDAAKVKCASDDNATGKCAEGSPDGYILKGQLSIGSPVVTDNWTIGSTPSPSIQWDKDGSIGDLKIEYSTTGTFTAGDYSGGNVYTIESSYPSGNDGVNNYAWQVGIIGANRKISDTGKIRLTTVSQPAGAELDISSNAFKIRPSIDSIDKPVVGGTPTVWYAVDTDAGQTIEWVSKSGTKSNEVVPTCIVEYSTNGTDYTTVPGGASVACGQGGHSLVWTPMADLRSATVRVRISYNDYTSVNLDSGQGGQFFTVRPKVVVTPTPDATTKLVVGTTYNNLIKWTYSGTTTNRKVEIRYDKNNENTFPSNQTIATDIDAGTGATGVTWTNVPNIIGADVKVRVFDKDFTASQADSPPFKVVGGIYFATPQSGVNRTADTTMSITWTYTGTIANFDIYYSSNSGGDWTADPIGSATDVGNCAAGSCSFSWLDTQADNIDTVLNTARFKITNALASDALLYAEGIAASDFKRGASVSALLPANGQVIYAGSTNTDITWNKLKGLSTDTKMKIEYTKNASSGTPTWIQIPDSSDPVNGYTANDGLFTWPLVPGDAAMLANDVRLRITQVYPDNSAVVLEGVYPSPVGVKGVLAVSAPAANVEWKAGETKDIVFQKTGAISGVKIYYSALGTFADEVQINTGTLDISGNGEGVDITWPWPIPADVTLTAGKVGKIRVKAETPSGQKTLAVSGDSGAFQVKGNIYDITLAAGDMEVSGSKVISWKHAGVIANYRIYYSYVMSGGPSWVEISGAGVEAATACSGGNCSWNWVGVPNTISNKVDFQVVDYSAANVNCVSDDASCNASPVADYIIQGKLDIVAPSGNETYSIGDPIPIKWTKTGSVGLLTLDYSTDNGGTWVTPVIDGNVAAGNDAPTENTYNGWTAPAKVSEFFKVRIRTSAAPAGAELATQSAASFYVRPTLTSFSTPVDATRWYSSDTNRTITWNGVTGVKNDATYPQVIVEYSVDGGLYTGNTIVDNYQFTATPRNATWAALPDVKSNNVKVKVTFKEYSNRTIESEAFDVFPILQVDAPTLDQQFTVGTTYDNLIKWSQTQGTGVTSVNIYYSTDNGGTWDPTPINGGTPVAVGVGATGYTWTIPNAIGNIVKIKVQDAAPGFEAVNAVSNKFTIRGGVTFSAPEGGVNRTADTALDVTWSYTGSIASFDLYYSVVSSPVFPGDYTQIGDALAAGTYCTGGNCTFNWPPDPVNNDGRVLNTASFYVDNNVSPASLLYSSEVGTEFKRGASVSALLPANGQVIYAGSTNTDITWTKLKGLSTDTKMKIEYTKNASSGTPTWIQIPDSADPVNGYTDNDGLFTWPLVPGDAAALANDVRLRITQANPDNSAVILYGVYPSPVGVKGVLTVSAPTTNAEWKAGETKNIVFQKTGAISGVKIYYSALGTFADEVQINTGTLDISGSNEGEDITWPWPIPADVTLTAGKVGKVRVKAETPSGQKTLAVQGDSGAFQVKGNIYDITLAAGDMEVSGSKVISWKHAGVIANYRVYYSYVMSGGPTWVEISGAGVEAASACSGGNCSWNWVGVPNTISNKVDFQVVDYLSSNVNCVSDDAGCNASPVADYIIQGTLGIVAPIGNETYSIGDPI
ncbi:MAG: hypothetical protein ABH891_03530, partial [Candidatus Omnitrophota bacterium]